MALLALIGILATVPMQLSINVPTIFIIDRALDLFTITIPPALPAAMSCGIVFAINRLKKQDIFCISPPRINMAGQISTFVFDKTGTLTEEGLSVLGFRPSANSVFDDFTNDPTNLTNNNNTLMLEAMASCTAITYVNGKLVGDPLDVKMF